MRSVVTADGETVDQLSTQPSGHGGQRSSDRAEDDGQHRGIRGCGPAQDPAAGEEHDDDDISDAMQQADPPGSRPAWNRQKVDEAEYGCDESADHAGRNHVERCSEESLMPVECERDQVEDQRRCQETEGKHDEHLMDGVPEELGPAFHSMTSGWRPRAKLLPSVMLTREDGEESPSPQSRSARAGFSRPLLSCTNRRLKPPPRHSRIMATDIFIIGSRPQVGAFSP